MNLKSSAINERVVEALRTVPAKKLRIVELVWDLVDDQGKLDADKCADKQPAINLAIAEARAYASTTKAAVIAIEGIRDSKSVGETR